MAGIFDDIYSSATTSSPSSNLDLSGFNPDIIIPPDLMGLPLDYLNYDFFLLTLFYNLMKNI